MLSRLKVLSRGVTLVELLVTLVILSVGVLGVAGLQVTSMQHSVWLETWLVAMD